MPFGEEINELEDALIKDDYKNIKDLRFLIKSGDSIPTYRPTKFYEQFYIYVSGVIRRLYIYVSSSSTWKYTDISGASFTVSRETLDESDMTLDSSWNELAIDSKYDGATMLLINLAVRGTVGDYLYLSGDGINTDLSLRSLNASENAHNQGLVPLGASSKLYYRGQSGLSVVSLAIIGYYK